MAIEFKMDVMMAERKIRLKDLAEKTGITQANLSNLKNGKVKAIRISTLESICTHLDCQPGDILKFDPNRVAQTDHTWDISSMDLPADFLD
ncbi:MAG: helix-turn-helix transcriptional regulator [Verrucomicrobia bacterium]|jgi:putative transcriptional regulator|nr:helix-turn-helix transcriptional regulator [Verrucomicrobiota bacterium]